MYPHLFLLSYVRHTSRKRCGYTVAAYQAGCKQDRSKLKNKNNYFILILYSSISITRSLARLRNSCSPLRSRGLGTNFFWHNVNMTGSEFATLAKILKYLNINMLRKSVIGRNGLSRYFGKAIPHQLVIASGKLFLIATM